MSRRRLLSVLLVLAVAAGGFVVRGIVEDRGRDPGRTAEARDTSFRARDARAAPAGASVIATARRRTIRVRRRPGGRLRRRISRRVFNGQRIPLTFAVRRQRRRWVQVDLPTRPNGSRGWVRRRDVRLSFTRLRIVVRVKRHRLELHDGKRVVSRASIALGKALSPTPHGRYYVTDVVRPSDPKGFYGPYALGLSAHSPVYTSFEGGDGQVGIHGTSQPGAIGANVSHGCIRVSNAVITRLARRVPLGTPVVIRN